MTTPTKEVKTDKTRTIRPKVKVQVLKEFFLEGGIYQGPALDVLIRLAEEKET